MLGLSEYVESSAIASIDYINHGRYIFNKYNRAELHAFDKESMKLKKISKLNFDCGIIQVKTATVKDYGEFTIVLLQDGRVVFYPLLNDLEMKEVLQFPSEDGLAYALSFIDVTDECLMIAGYRGSMLLRHIPCLASSSPEIKSPEPSRSIDFDGVLLLARLVQVSGVTYVFSVTHNDNGKESGVVMHKVIENRKPEFLTSFKLPRGFLMPNIMVQLGDGYFLLIDETNGLLLKLNDTELIIKNQFIINTQAPSSYTEVPTLISAVSNVFRTDFGEAFLASTNKGEFLCFEHNEGQFVISPVRLSDTEFPIKPIFSAIHYSCEDDIVLAAGENMDGAVMQFSKAKYALELVRPIPNWAPIIDIDSTRQKNGIVTASSGVPGICGSLHQVRKGIRNQIVSQTDQCFRGANRVWALKRYKSDKHHSFVAASFTNSTMLFRIKDLELEMISACELETAYPTVLLANLDTTSFWIQVCPDRVLAVKISEPDELKAPVASIWRPEKLLVSAAAIIGNLVILLDDANGCIHFLKVSCKISTGRADISVVGGIDTGHQQGTSLAVCPSTYKSDTEILVAASIDGRCEFWEVTCDDVFSDTKLFDFETLSSVNNIAFWRRDNRTFFAIGYRNGDASFYKFDSSGPVHLSKLLETHIGDDPVKLVVVQDDHVDRQAICCTSRGVWFISHTEDSLLHAEKFHPHVECFVEIYLTTGSRQRTFLATRKDMMSIIEADLSPSSWLYPLFSGPNLRRIMINDGTSLVSSVSDPTCPLGSQNSLELFKLSDLETVMRTKIPAHITAICPLSIAGLFAVATIDANGQGAVHVYSCASFQDKDRSIKRRSSVADAKRAPSSFHFVAASSGFYSSVSSLCEVLEGVLLISCRTDVYLLKLDVVEPALQIFRSEPRRSPAYCMSAYPISDSVAKVAIYDEDGIEIIEINMASEKVLTHVSGDTSGRTGGKVAWINERYILVTDKKGVITIVDTQDPTSVWLKTVQQYKIADIPYSICRNPEKSDSLLIGSMLGAIYQFDLDSLLHNTA